MSDTLVTADTPIAFFREQLAKAMEHQRVSTSAFTEFYLVNLLAAAVHAESLPPREPGFDETPLSLLYVRALQADALERGRRLRAMGDTALFVSGFFPDSVDTRLVSLEFYQAMGRRAYDQLSAESGGIPGLDVFAELARRFGAFADVLNEVSEQSRLGSPQSVVRLYERWEQTGSARAAALLAARGIDAVRAEDGGPH